MAPKAKKVLNQSDIKQRAERWAGCQKQLETLEAEKEKALEPAKRAYAKKAEPIIAEYDAKIDPIQERSDALEEEITNWLNKQTKSVTVESKSAIAIRSIGTKLGNRVVNAEKFVERCIERKIKDFWKLVGVTIKDAETVMGKDDMAEICKQPSVKSETSTLELKD